MQTVEKMHFIDDSVIAMKKVIHHPPQIPGKAIVMNTLCTTSKLAKYNQPLI